MTEKSSIFKVNFKIIFYCFISILILLNSCENNENQTQTTLLEYTKEQVSNPSSVVIHDFKVLVKHDKFARIHKESKFSYITDSTSRIDYLYSAINRDGIEVFRKVQANLDENKKISKTFPENISVENGHLMGFVDSNFGNLLTNDQLISCQMNDSEIILVSLDTLRRGMFYKTNLKQDIFDMKNLIPGNYFFKIVNRNFELKSNLLYYNSRNPNLSILLNIKKLMDFCDIYLPRYYGFKNRKLFLKIYEDELNFDKLELEQFYSDSYVESIWKDFIDSMNDDFINDLKINKDYKFPFEFDKIEIKSEEYVRNDIKIDHLFF